MKRSDIISSNYKAIAAAMVENYRAVLESDGRIQYSLYIWENGELETLEGVQGDNTWLQPRDGEPMRLFFVNTIKAPFFDPWDYSDHSAPDDEALRESERREIVDFLVQEYETDVADVLDGIISEAETEERYYGIE